MTSVVVALGPQQGRPSITGVLRDLGVRGPVALISAGWQEREAESGLLPDLGVPVVNLTLHARGDDVFRREPELAAASKQRQTQLKMMQDFYRVRLDHAAQAARAISLRHVDLNYLDDEYDVSRDVIRNLDETHLARCAAVRGEFERNWPLAENPAIKRHHAELEELIAPTDALVIAGGHVAVLMNRMRLFDVLGLAGKRPIIGWSAGAMALTERIGLFHDHPPYGEAIAEVFDAGFGLLPGVVAMPDPKLRLQLDDHERVAQFADRFAPAACLAMDAGAQVVMKTGADGARLFRSVDAQRLCSDGELDGSTRSWS